MKEGIVPRGQTSPVGAERTAPNGYQYIKLVDGWKLRHWIIFEEKYGRPVDPKREQIRFVDGNKNNFDPSNIISVPLHTGSLRRREAELKTRIADLQSELTYVQKQLANLS